MPIDPAAVAVASRSFSRNPVLRAELLERYPRSRFNDEGTPVLSGEALVRFLRGHDIRDYHEFYREAGVTPVTLDMLLAQSDIVTIHVPLDASTRGLIDARALARMKPDAFLVNTARGGVVDEEALKHALAAGRLG